MNAGVEYDPVTLPDGMDYVMRPVIGGLCRYESLKDGTLTLYDIAIMHDAMNARDENAARARKAQEKSDER